MKIKIKKERIKANPVKTFFNRLSLGRFISKLLADLNKNPVNRAGLKKKLKVILNIGQQTSQSL
jgi:hypothetical protein